MPLANCLVLPPSSWRQATVHRTVAFNYSSPFAKKNKRKAKAFLLFLVRRKGLVSICPWQIVWCCRHPAGGKQQSTGLLHFIIRVPLQKIKGRPKPSFYFWYAGRDSNPQPSEPESDALSIEPPAHFASLIIIADSSRFVKPFLKKSTCPKQKADTPKDVCPNSIFAYFP